MGIQLENRAGRRACSPGGLSLPVIADRPGKVRPSRMGRRRAAALIGVHVLILAHVAHWLISGRTISPIEPSEAMYTLNDGHLNAGFLFLLAAIAATALCGRFVCGWGCHVIAYQDLCAWLLRKMHVKPKPFRSRVLVLAPLALALYMFVWPSVYRWWMGAPRPTMSNHLVTTEFWKTFPGPVVAVVTVLICGFVIIYFLGSKGFCTYGCPYGGFFALADQVSPGRIRVTDACEHCGHCTATCTSNVRVHEEVARYGMVVDPGCMKCMDCVSVCPNDALYFGYGKPSLVAAARADAAVTPKPRAYDFTLSEELLMVGVGLGALLAFRGLYEQIPLLLAMGLAAITAYLLMKLVRVVCDRNVRLQQLQLKRGGRITRAGTAFAAGVGVWLIVTAHSGLVQYHTWRGGALVASVNLGDEVWAPETVWWDRADGAARADALAAMDHLQWVDRWGLMPTASALAERVWLHLARGEDDVAERLVRRLVALHPDRAAFHRGLGNVLRKQGRVDEADAAFREAIALDLHLDAARADLAGMLASAGRVDEAAAVYRDAIEHAPDSVRWPLALGRLLMRHGRYGEARPVLAAAVEREPEAASAHVELGIAYLQMGAFEEGVRHLRRGIELEPSLAEGHYNLALALLNRRDIDGAVEHFAVAARLKPEVAVYHYNLGVATFMGGRPADALPHVREAVRLDPDDPQARGFLAVVEREVGRSR